MIAHPEISYAIFDTSDILHRVLS